MVQWLQSSWHKLLIMFLAADHLIRRLMEWEEDFVKIKAKFGRRIGDSEMDILELPQFIKDVVQFASDVKAAEAIVAPQFPQLIADAEKIKADGEKLLGIAQ